MRVHRMALFTAVCALVLTGCGASSAALTDTDRTAITTTLEAFPKAILAGDFKAAAALWTEDAIAMPPHAAEARGRADIEKLFASFGKTTAFTQNIVETQGRGDLAYSRLTFAVTFTPAGSTAAISDRGKVLVVLARQTDGSWRTARAAWNSDLPLPK